MATDALKAQKELCGQILTLSTTLIAFTVTFADKFGVRATKESPLTAPPELQWAWGLYFLSIVFGLWATMAIVGTMTASEAGPPVTPGRDSIKLPAILMILAFLAALVLTVLAGRRVLG